ncbi:MAG: RDD family protein [Blastocatellia bacterium]
MMNDTVREELQTKVSQTAESSVNSRLLMDSPSLPESIAPIASPKPQAQILQNPITSGLSKKETSPTLVEFQNKNATLPDWRLQLQNSVRQRNNGNQHRMPETETDQPVYQKTRATNGANALKIEISEEPTSQPVSNPMLESALKRIEESRRAFLPKDGRPSRQMPSNTKSAIRNYPFNVVSRSADLPTAPDSQSKTTAAARPKLVSSLRIEKKGFDTNKLPPIPKLLVGSLVIESQPKDDFDTARNADHGRIEIKESIREEEISEIEIPETEEIDDLAPFSMRFAAGVFDLIVGGFASAIILSPFMLSGGAWLSLPGFFAFAAALSIVMFVYLTGSIAYAGRTLGMRIFSLEIIDAAENEYPTLHQAAVSSAVYLLSLAFGGAGFLTMLFNEEKRAAHDIVSGTLLVREY